MRGASKAVSTALFLSLALCAPAAAEQLEDAAAAWRRQDFVTAERLYRPLAEGGRASAQHFLGKMYENGLGVPQDYVQAAKWYRLAAEQGHGGAQLFLAGMYAAGEGVPRDYVQAYKWFELSAAGGGGDFAASSRDKVAAKLTPAQIAEAQRLVRNWKPATPK